MVLSAYNWRTRLAYLDNVITFLTLFKAHLQEGNIAPPTLRELGVSPNQQKCFPIIVEHRGHIIHRAVLTTREARVMSFGYVQNARNVIKPRSFLRLCIFYRRSIPGCMDIATLLMKFLSNGQRMALPTNSEL